MKKILVPTDFSPCAIRAADLALEIASKANAEIHFLHTLHTPTDWVKLSLEKEKLYPETQAQIAHAKVELHALMNRAEKLGLKAEQHLVFDRGRDEIDQHIKDHQHDFIVMGSKGTSGTTSLIGTNTQKVVRYSAAPVLVVKENSALLKDFNHLVFASTFEEDVHAPFHKIIEFADLVDAKIHLLYVNMPFQFKETDQAEADMEAFLAKCPRGTCSINIFNALNEERGILKFAGAVNANAIALTTHGRTGFMKMLSPSITESLVNHSEIPVLSVNINTD